MSNFIDARCQKCKAKVSWVGEMKDHPACGKCGFKPAPESLEADTKEMEAFKELLRRKNRLKNLPDGPEKVKLRIEIEEMLNRAEKKEMLE